MDADDTARAPMAKAILQSKELPWPMEIGSRGLVVLFPQPVNQKVEAVLARNGLSAKDHTTTPLTAEDINDDTLLLVMEDSQRKRSVRTSRMRPICRRSPDFCGWQETSLPFTGNRLPNTENVMKRWNS